jgi:hypothetical protein
MFPTLSKSGCSLQSADSAGFYASLDQKDKIIHDLAAKMLKTRYDPKRSNAYMKWTAKATEQKLNA